MKRVVALLLALLLVSAIPCYAVDYTVPTTRTYTGFPDVSEDSWYYDAVKLCYETGLIDGKTNGTFDPYGQLTMGQLIVLAARLYDLRLGGDGTIPALPDDLNQYVRFYDSDETVVGDLSCVTSIGYGAKDLRFTFLDGTLTGVPHMVRVGFESYTFHLFGEGSVAPSAAATTNELKTLASENGASVTRYSYQIEGHTSKEAWDLLSNYLDATSLAKQNGAWQKWWYPAYFDLAYRENVSLLSTGDLINVKNMSRAALREDFALLLWSVAVTPEAINPYPTIPDVSTANYTQEQISAIEGLYTAGILNGVDSAGTFRGTATLTRAQAAVMLARVLDTRLRIRVE